MASIPNITVAIPPFRDIVFLLCFLIPLNCFALPVTHERAQFISLHGIKPSGISVVDLQATYHRLCGTLAPGRAVDRSPCTLVFYSTSRGTSPFPDGVLPEWAGGCVIGPDSILIPLDGAPLFHVTLRQRIDHELAHLALSRSCPGVALPRWFHEGVAMTLSADAARAEWLSISLAMITHSLLPLHAIDSLNTFNRNKAHLAYCQSHQAVLFLVKNYGMHGIAAIVREARRRGDFWAGMGEVLALTPEEFDRIMHREWAQQYRMAFLFSETLFFWPVVVLVFCIGVVRTIIRNRKRRREFDRQEKENAGTENDADDAG